MLPGARPPVAAWNGPAEADLYLASLLEEALREPQTQQAHPRLVLTQRFGKALVVQQIGDAA